MFCHRTKGAAGRGGNIVFAKQIERELSPTAPCTFSAGNINQGVECSMRRVKVATEILEEAYREIASMLVDLAHFNDAILGTCQSSSSGSLDPRIAQRAAEK